MRKFLLFILFYGLVMAGHSQKVLMEEDPAVDTIPECVGPNLKHFFHPYYGYGMFFGKETAGAEIKNARSYYLTIGGRYKRRFSDYYSLGFDFGISNTTYCLTQKYGKVLPNSTLHKKERLSWMFVNAALFNRFNFYKRGNTIGSYIDLGAEVGYSFSFTHFYYNKVDGQQSRTRIRGLSYFEPFYYSVFARWGYDRFSVSCAYRLSNSFKSSSNYPNLPPLCVSIQLAIY